MIDLLIDFLSNFVNIKSGGRAFLGFLAGIAVMAFVVLAGLILAPQSMSARSSYLMVFLNIVLPLCINGILLLLTWSRGQKSFFRGLLVATALILLLDTACVGSIFNSHK